MIIRFLNAQNWASNILYLWLKLLLLVNWSFGVVQMNRTQSTPKRNTTKEVLFFLSLSNILHILEAQKMEKNLPFDLTLQQLFSYILTINIHGLKTDTNELLQFSLDFLNRHLLFIERMRLILYMHSHALLYHAVK